MHFVTTLHKQNKHGITLIHNISLKHLLNVPFCDNLNTHLVLSSQASPKSFTLKLDY